MASKFLNVKFSTALKASLPTYIIFFAAIAFTIFVPEAVLWLSKQVFPESVGVLQGAGRNGVYLPVNSERRVPWAIA